MVGAPTEQKLRFLSGGDAELLLNPSLKIPLNPDRVALLSLLVRGNVLTTGKVEVVTAAPLFAGAIYRLHNNLGLTDLFLREGSLSSRR